MKTDDFDYELPLDLIAQTPLKKRDDSKLMILDRKTGIIKHEVFSNIINYLNEDDILVLNDTKVMPARIIGEKEDTGAVIEFLLLKNIKGNTWEVLTKPAKRIKVGSVVSFGGGMLTAKCSSVGEEGIREVEFKYDAKPGYDEGAIISQSRPKDMPVVKGVSIEIHVATKYTAPETETENNEENN